MSAPNTNLSKQKRRHKGPLIGMALGMVVVLLLLLWFLSRVFDTDSALEGTPEEAAVMPADSAVEAPADASTAPDDSSARD